MSSLTNPAAWLIDALSAGGTTRAGQRINETSALTLPTYYAIVRNIAEDVAKVPFPIYRESGRSKTKAPEHPAFDLINYEPNPENTAMAFRELLTEWAVNHGAGFAEIVRAAGQPEQLWPIHPSRVKITRDDSDALWFQVRFNCYHDNYPEREETVVIPAADMLVIRGFGCNGIVGYSLLRVAAESLGLGLALQSYGSTFFGGSTAINSILKAPQKLDEAVIEKIRESWVQRYTGPEANQKPAILPPGWEFSRVDISPDNAQAVESRKFQVEDVARIARMPLSKIGAGNSAGGEMEAIAYVTDTLMPWYRRWEEEVNRKLIRPEDRAEFYAKHTLQGLMRGDHAARGNFYQTLYHVSALSPNDIRELEDMDPIDGGDEYFAPMNMVPLSRVEDLADSQIKKAGQSQATMKNPTDQGGGSNNAPDPNDPPPPPNNRPDQSALAIKFLLPMTTRLCVKESKAIKAATSKHTSETFPDWAREFYPTLAAEASDLLAGPIEACRELTGCAEPDLGRWYTSAMESAIGGGRLDSLGPDAPRSMAAMIVGAD